MRGEWRDGTFAEYAKVPLESCFALDEGRLTGSIRDGGLGYEVEQLAYITSLLVPYGGLRDIGLQAGETVIVAPRHRGFRWRSSAGGARDGCQGDCDGKKPGEAEEASEYQR